MPGPQPALIRVSARQQAILARLTRCPTSPQALVRRAQIILAAAAGERNEPIARRLGGTRTTVRGWRRRWAAATARLDAMEAAGDSDQALSAAIEAVLADEPRSGAPPSFTPEHICQIIALACEEPAASARPVTHWTPHELAAEAVQRGIVARISPRTVGRFLKRGQAQTAPGALLAHPPAGRGPGGLRPGGRDRL